MNTYQVVRPFGEYRTGDTLQDADFISVQRTKQLISQRYIALVVPHVVEVTAEEQPRKRGKKEGDNAK